MAYLVDTNVLIRLIDSTDEQHRLATAAVEQLVASEETLSSVPRSWSKSGPLEPVPER